MKVGIWPFYSQQDKYEGLILQQTCGAAKQLSFLATILEQNGHKCKAMVPTNGHDSSPFTCQTYRTFVPQQNPLQRLHWDATTLYSFFFDCDVAICNSEYLAIPLRAVLPKLKIVQMCSVRPDNMPLFCEAWASADLVVAQGKYAASRIRARCATKVAVWPLAYDERRITQSVARDIDVCFVQRCSANNATHHEEFLRAMSDDWSTVFTDVTNYLRKQRRDLTYSTPDTYYDTLSRSKVAVSMYDSWYGGLSIREAIAHGCTPVVLDAPCYRELCGRYWPYYVEHPVDIKKLRAVIERALGDSDPPKLDVSGESYQVGARIAMEDLCRL